MQYHASCVALDGAGVLLVGDPGVGKSDLVLRLLDHNFTLVADDRVVVEDGLAWAPPGVAGLLEVRGLGIVKLPYSSARLALVVRLGRAPRLPSALTFAGVPLVHVDAGLPSAPARVTMALRCALRQLPMLVGALE